MRIKQLTIAVGELRDAMSWYHERSPRAAENLWLSIQNARHSILLFPCAAPLIERRVRRFVLAGFPYDVIYAILEDEILIVAYAHHSRQPGYWKERLGMLYE